MQPRRRDMKAMAVCGRRSARIPPETEAMGRPAGAAAAPSRPPTAASITLHAAARLGNPKLLAQLLQQGADVWEHDACGMLPLHAAATCGSQRAVAALVAHEPRVLDATTTDGLTALYLAASHGHLGAAEELLVAGADANTGDSKGRTPLQAAAAGGRDGEHLARLLLNAGADAALTDRRGRTALHIAAEAVCEVACSAGVLLCLARHSPCLLGTPAHDGSTPLHSLCRSLGSGTSSMCALQALADSSLVSSQPATLNAADGCGLTPLALAAQAGSLPAIQLLQLCGANSCHQPCCCSAAQHHICPLGLALSRRHYNIVLHLTAGGASAAGLGCDDLRAALEDGRADVLAALVASGLRCATVQPLLLAAVQSLLKDSVPLLCALLDGGLDPNSSPDDPQAAQSLLQAALQPGREALLHQLLVAPPAQQPAPQHAQHEQRAMPPIRKALDVAALTQRLQYSPAHYAVLHSSVPALRQLLAAGCPPTAVPAGSGQPPLVAAAARLDLARCQVLLQAGAPADERSRGGDSALEAVLALCTDARLIELAAEETQGAAAASEHQLLCLVELLLAAGATCNCFLAEHRPALDGRVTELVHSSLSLAVGAPHWSPATHHLWPPAFRSAASAALLALRGRGRRAEWVPTAGGRTGQDRRQVSSVLPQELCHVIMAHAALPLSCWVGE